MAPLFDEERIRPEERVGRLVWAEPVTIDEKLTLRSVAAVLRADDIGAALVRRDDRIAGIVSERDVVRALADDADPDTVWSADVMTEELSTTESDAPILRVALEMLEQAIRHVAITEDSEVVGIVSARDVFRVLAEDSLAAH
jgi:signal-transduction protein with cAMP-binding, CBS, and nucleotidyltransferase domain